MQFCTVINCIDGRVQLPVIKYLQKRFNVEYVDSITESGINLVLAESEDPVLVRTIIDRVTISVEKHDSVGIAVVGHHDCVRNTASKNDQTIHTKKAIEFLREQYENIKIIGLWVDENWDVHEVV